MKIELFAYNPGTYCDLDEAQEAGAIYLISRAAGALDLTSLKMIKECMENATKAFADMTPVLFVKAGGIDHSFESILGEFEKNTWLSLSEIALFYQSKFETDFNRVRASITWNGSTSMVTITNTRNYIDLETCDFCSKCDNCKVDASYFYYADSLSELDRYLDTHHHDGWIINSYSVEE